MPLKCYLAKAGNKLQIGFLQFHDLSINGEEYIYIAELAIDPAYQRKGIGTQLINMVLDGPNEKKASYLILTRSFNEKAEALYKKLGFIRIDGQSGDKLVAGCGYDPDRYIALVKRV